MEKYQRTNIETGLTIEEVEKRINDGLVNYDTTVPTKSICQIILNNVITLFNIINLLLGIAVFIVGSYKNLTFLGIIFCNTLISIFQEIHAKKTIDKLAVLASNKAKVIRDGRQIEIDVNEVVLDDLIVYELGDQVIADSIILEGDVEVNESFITGEADALEKHQNDLLKSGSFIVLGHTKAQIRHVGEDNYTSQISSGAKYVKKVNSEIMHSLNSILKLISIFIFPLAILLFYREYFLPDSNITDCILHTVAALIGMIPEGLILLTSTVLAVSVMRLAKFKVLVQELYCIETLARVDVLCLDKTGTITEGVMEVVDLVVLDNKVDVKEILGTITKALEDKNPTAMALSNYYLPKTIPKVVKKYPFSSAKKRSGVTLEDGYTYFLGAKEFVLEKKDHSLDEKIVEYAKNNRVLVLARGKMEKDEFTNSLALAIILLQDKIKNSAKKTLSYFKKQNVDLKIISGDDVNTVYHIAKKAGLEVEKFIDCSSQQDDTWLNQVDEYTVFGRVAPKQKQQIVKALQQKGHTVAMTGDGVNDVLALKESDCSIAMGNGSEAARNVSQLVLLNSDFSAMPHVVFEGRRTINNIQRSASLFLVKTIFSFLLSVLILFTSMSYPFMPIQLSLISVVTIGIPSFILALESNKEKIKGHFFINVVSKALPASLTIVLNIIMISILSQLFSLSYEISSTMSVLITASIGFMLLHHISQPFNLLRKILFFSMLSIFIVAIIVFYNLFNIVLLPIVWGIVLVLLIIESIYCYRFLIKHVDWYAKRLLHPKSNEFLR